MVDGGGTTFAQRWSWSMNESVSIHLTIDKSLRLTVWLESICRAHAPIATPASSADRPQIDRSSVSHG
jgi:hypothetical protein